MQSIQKISKTIAFVAALTISSVAFAADKGYLGFGISVNSEGFSFNPVLKSVSVDSVAPGSPAAIAGLVKGDEFVEVEGHVVAGSKANDLKPYLAKNVGETVNFKVKKASGEVVVVVLTAAKRP